MKAFILTAMVLGFSSFAQAGIECRFQSNGVDLGLGVSANAEKCSIGNGYTYAEYHATVTQADGVTTYTCQTTTPYSAYSPLMVIKIAAGKAMIQTSDNHLSSYAIHCK